MTESYKEFDKAPIVEDDIIIKGYKFRKRELALAAVAGIALFVCVILAALLASAKNSQNNAPINVNGSTAAQTGAKGICLDTACLEAAAFNLKNMNTTVDPCKNFYQYSCGSFVKNNPLPPDRSQLSTKWNIYYANEQKLRRLLEKPSTRHAEWAAERKLKDFFASCMDDYAKMMAGGNPFLKRVLPKVGGWYVLGTWDESKYDYQDALRKTHVDFWTNAFFTFYVKTDFLDWKKRSLQIDLSGMGMSWVYYINKDTDRERDDYKRFIRTVAGYLIDDANITLTAQERKTRIDTFVNDTFYVERMLAQITGTSDPSANPHDYEKRLSLKELASKTEGGIDWVAFFKYMFADAGVTENTKVVVLEMDYISKVDRAVKDLGKDRKRMINNYLVWRLAQKYVQDLSWKYIHANRMFYVDMTGSSEFLGAWRYCFRTVDRDMTFAMSSLYVKDHFVDKNKDKAHEIVDYVREALIDSLTGLTWMDDDTKTKAKRKLKESIYKLGYPDFMMNDDKVDQIYRPLKIDRFDYFKNLLSLNAFYKSDWNTRLKNPTDTSEWTYHTYDIVAQYYNPWKELMVPAGLLQFPYYDYTLPHYANFGTLGVLVAHQLIHAVDQQGALFKLDGSWWGRWWSNATVSNYKNVRQCVINLFKNKSQGPFHLPGEGPVSVPVNGAAYVPEAMAETSGVRVAYKAYQKWIADKGQEKSAPGLGKSNDQMFFLSYAQSNCYNRYDVLAFNQASRYEMQENMKVNMALRQVDEFRQTFKCPQKSPMVSTKKCGMY